MEYGFGNLNLTMPVWVLVAMCASLAFVVTYSVIPSIVKVSHLKGLFDNPDSRKSHTSAVPTLGGAAVFIGLILPTVLFGDQGFEHQLKFIIVGLLILFFVGIKDDILVISARKKLLAEIFAISVVVVLGNIRVTSFHGFLGIEEIPYALSVLFTVFVFIVVINGLNLIDGIDGLASGVGILTISIFGVWFLLIEDYAYAAFSFSAVGALVAFFRFNAFGKAFKIFLGDTGSLIVGMVLSIMVISFLESSLTHPMGTIGDSAPVIAFSILIVPMIDTLRVFTLRILWGKSPFHADRYHVHHRLLDLGYSHLKVTSLILSVNLLIILISLALSGLGNLRLLAVVLPLSVIATSIPSLMIRFRHRRVIEQTDMLRDKTWIIPFTFRKSILSRYSARNRTPEVASASSFSSRMEPRDLEPVFPDPYSWYLNRDSDSLEHAEMEEYPD